MSATIRLFMKRGLTLRSSLATLKVMQLKRTKLFGVGKILVFSRIASLPITVSPNEEIIVYNSNTNQQPTKSLLSKIHSVLANIIDALCTLLRTFQLAIIFTPFLITAPFALYNTKYQPLVFKILARTLEFGGPVFVKLGQWASTRRDLFPLLLCQELSRLQRESGAHSWKDTKEILIQSYGWDYEKIFSDFSCHPVGSGCCAQVHKATLRDGDYPVAVKVLHPKIESKFHRDLAVMHAFVNILNWTFPKLNYLSLKESLNQFDSLMTSQINLLEEIKNLERFTSNFSNEPSIVFPKPVIELCKENIIVESYEEGEHIGDYIESEKFQTDIDARKSLAETGVQMLLKMVFVHNFVHGDLHPGNILIRRNSNDPKNYQLVILDPGIVSTLSSKDNRNFRQVFTAIVKGDGQVVGKLFLEHSSHQCTDEEAFIKDMSEVVLEARSHQLSLSRIDVSELLTKAFNQLLIHRVKLEANYASVVLAILVLEGLGRTLDPNIDIALRAFPYLLGRKN